MRTKFVVPVLGALILASLAAFQNCSGFSSSGMLSLNNNGSTSLRSSGSGTLDTNFGQHGFLDLGRFSMSVNSLAAQSDGKYLILTPKTNPSGAYVTRYNSDSSVDTSYGRSGVAFTVCGPNADANCTPQMIFVQNDNKAIVDFWDITFSQSILARFNADGSLDTSYGTNGYATSQYQIDVFNSYLDSISNNITAAARLPSDTNDSAVLRISPAGVFQSLPVPGGGSVMGVISAGASDSYWVSTQHETHLLSAAGTLGPSVAPNSFGVIGNLSVVQSDGRFVILYNGNKAIYRYNADGSLDTSFGNQGIVDCSDFCGTSSRLLMDSSGNLIVVGATDSSIVVARYSSDGSLDMTYGLNGTFMQNFGGSSSKPSALSVQFANGELVLLIAIFPPTSSNPENPDNEVFVIH